MLIASLTLPGKVHHLSGPNLHALAASVLLRNNRDRLSAHCEVYAHSELAGLMTPVLFHDRRQSHSPPPNCHGEGPVKAEL